jgi:hypothetical protein
MEKGENCRKQFKNAEYTKYETERKKRHEKNIKQHKSRN